MSEAHFIPDIASPVPQDIKEAASRISPLVIENLKNANLLVTGGTGFLGSWLVDILLDLNKCHHLKLTLHILTRHKQELLKRRPDWIEQPEIILIEGDVKNFECDGAAFTHIFHGATDVATNNATPYELSETIVSGAKNVLTIAAQAGAKRYLFFSSGAVTGNAGNPISEDALTAPAVDEPSAYGNSKRFAEHLHLLAGAELGLKIVIARGFAFAGPRMPLNKFAFGNFVRDALRGKAPHINSTGNALRSYLYAADAAVWLITLLCIGKPGRIYNVGSDTALSIRDLAKQISDQLGSPPPVILGWEEDGSSGYIPNISRIKEEFGLIPTENLDRIISKTAEWASTSGTIKQ